MLAFAGAASAQQAAKLRMQVFRMSGLLDKQEASGKPWLPFLKAPALYCGVYHLAAGAEDNQRPHDDDEVYYVESGRAVIRVEGEGQPVEAGSIIYVPARADHKFIRIEEDLKLLVFFSNA